MSKHEEPHLEAKFAQREHAKHSAWDTTIKLGAIEESKCVQAGDIVVAVNTASGELTVRRMCEKAPHGRSTEPVT